MIVWHLTLARVSEICWVWLDWNDPCTGYEMIWITFCSIVWICIFKFHAPVGQLMPQVLKEHLLVKSRWIFKLVGGLEHFLLSHILGIIIPIIFFRGFKPPTSKLCANTCVPHWPFELASFWHLFDIAESSGSEVHHAWCSQIREISA